MPLKETLQSALRSVSTPDWVANVVALAALVASLYSIKVSREIASEQIEREEAAKAMQYTIALRFEGPYVPRFLNTVVPDRPGSPPYLVVSARLFFTNGSTLPQAFNGVMFSYDGLAYYPVLGVREQSGAPVNWPLNIAPGVSIAFDVDVPLPVSQGQEAAIRGALRRLKTPVRSWRDFEDRVLRETSAESARLLDALPRTTYFWIETLSPSPGSPRRIVFDEWVPPKWRSGSTNGEDAPSNKPLQPTSGPGATP